MRPDVNSRVASSVQQEAAELMGAVAEHRPFSCLLHFHLRLRGTFASKLQLLWCRGQEAQGGVTSHHHVEVPGALLDGCAAGSYAASVLFCKIEIIVASPGPAYMYSQNEGWSGY